jgi:hypothetical protein
MNAAAKEKLGLKLEGLTVALLKNGVSEFGEMRAEADTGKAAIRIAKIRIGRRRLECSIEPIELSCRRPGLAISECAPKEAHSLMPAPAPPEKLAQMRRAEVARDAGPRGPAARVLPKHNLAPSPLTPSEIRSLGQIAKTVLKLAAEKQRQPDLFPRAPQAKQAGRKRNPPEAGADPFWFFPAFDAVLLLDEHFRIVGIKGRPSCLGRSQSGLEHRPVTDLFPEGERAIFLRMARKLRSGKSALSRETILISESSRRAIPCHAVLARQKSGDGHYFLGLLQLKLPKRLKSIAEHTVSNAKITRLAA